MKSTAVNTQNRITLHEEHVYFGGMNLTYQLMLVRGEELHSFCIRVRKGGEVQEVDVGTDLSRALSWYEAIVRGTVTPCTLEEVVKELQYA